MRFWTSLFHALVAWGFMVYLWVNCVDILRAYDSAFQLTGLAGNLYRLLADLSSLGVLIGMLYLVLRRWLIRPASLDLRDAILIHPQARAGIQRDSAVVAGLISVHVAARFMGDALAPVNQAMAQSGPYGPIATPFDAWQPFTSLFARLWVSLHPSYGSSLFFAHLFFWLSLGALLIFIPYFLVSKHVHLIFAPLNFLLKPGRRYWGELKKIDLEDESVSQFGATRLEDLGWEQLMDAYACVMCFRCQEVCPAYQTGKVLSPAALEINKRYFLNAQGREFIKGEKSAQPLTQFVLAPEAVWACTACGACEDSCPVGNEPMHDILEIRRALVLMEGQYPKKLQTAYRGMERVHNPWGVPGDERMSWADGLDIPTLDENPHPDILWWVGCAPAFDPNSQRAARAFARILNAADVNYAVLGNLEQCTGDLARRSGKEDLFFQLAGANIATLNAVKPKRIVTICPHCLHTLKNEYRDLGGNYVVVHHTQLIGELISNGRLLFDKPGAEDPERIAFHDPCYLSRFNSITVEPRLILRQLNADLVELPRHGSRSSCCGAGGAQVWIDEEAGAERINRSRFREAQKAGVDILAVGCPFCQVLLNDAARDASSDIRVRDIAELVVERMEKSLEKA